MKKLVKIKSISDVITNSSTEVFIIKMDDKFNSIKNKLEYSEYFTFFEDEKCVKKVILKYIENNAVYELENLFDNAIDSGISGWEFKEFIEFCQNTLNKTPEEIYEFFKPLFNQLVGYAWVEEEDNCSTFIIDELAQYGYHCVDRC